MQAAKMSNSSCSQHGSFSTGRISHPLHHDTTAQPVVFSSIWWHSPLASPARMQQLHGYMPRLYATAICHGCMPRLYA